MGLLKMVLKPQFQAKFKFDEIHSVKFEASKLDDTLVMSGRGRVGIDIICRSTPVDKLSNHEDEMGAFFTHMSAGKDAYGNRIDIDPKMIDAATIYLDFSKNKTTAEIYYRNEAGEKLHDTFVNGF